MRLDILTGRLVGCLVVRLLFCFQFLCHNKLIAFTVRRIIEWLHKYFCSISLYEYLLCTYIFYNEWDSYRNLLKTKQKLLAFNQQPVDFYFNFYFNFDFDFFLLFCFVFIIMNRFCNIFILYRGSCLVRHLRNDELPELKQRINRQAIL